MGSEKAPTMVPISSPSSAGKPAVTIDGYDREKIARLKRVESERKVVIDHPVKSELEEIVAKRLSSSNSFTAAHLSNATKADDKSRNASSSLEANSSSAAGGSHNSAGPPPPLVASE